MTDYGPAYVDRGWALTATGQLRRATSIVDKVSRLLAPLFGAVWSEPWRGNAARPDKALDALPVIISDRVRFVLRPPQESAEISRLEVTTTREPGDQRARVVIRFLDEHKLPHELERFVRVA